MEIITIIAEATSLSTDAKWFIGILLGAIGVLWREFRSMNKNNQDLLKASNEESKKLNKTLALMETHTKETKHALQNLPCNPKEKEDEKIIVMQPPVVAASVSDNES